MLKKYFFLFVISIIIYFVHASYTYQGLYGDGNGYYVYTQSILFDHSLNSAKVYDYLNNFKGKNYIFSRIFWNQDKNPYSIGTGLIWIPSLIIMSGISANRFDLINELGAGITGILLIISGLYFLEKYLLNFYSKKIVFWAIGSIFFATNVFYYTAFEPALSHQPSFFIISFLLWWTYKFNKTKFYLLILGIISGFLATVRIVDIILLIPIFWQIKPKAKDFIFLLIGGIAGYSPQLLNQYFAYGNIFINPYLNGANGTWRISLIHLTEYLISPKRGLFLWSPILLISFWGLLKSKSYIFISTIIILWMVTSSWSAYTSAGFGQRLSFSAIPYFAYGLASVYNKLRFKYILLALTVFFIWNLLLLKNIYLHKNIFIQKDDFKIGEFSRYMFKLN